MPNFLSGTKPSSLLKINSKLAQELVDKDYPRIYLDGYNSYLFFQTEELKIKFENSKPYVIQDNKRYINNIALGNAIGIPELATKDYFSYSEENEHLRTMVRMDELVFTCWTKDILEIILELTEVYVGEYIFIKNKYEDLNYLENDFEHVLVH